jgi:glycine/D-amino acid oxidase-like deaminating enzyme
MKPPRDRPRYWADRNPESRRKPHPVLRGSHTADAVVIGGGIVGAAAAYALANAGVSVMLVEANRVANGATAGGLGTIVPGPDASFRSVAEMRGPRIAKPAWHEAHRSALEFSTLLKKLKIRCDLTSASALVNARTSEDAAALKREQAARKSAGVDVPWIAAPIARRELGTESEGAMRLHDAATFDPVRATLGLIAAAKEKKARVFEKSRVVRTKFTRKEATVFLDTGARITTGMIVVATGEPGTLFGQLRRHVKKQDGYVVVTEPLTAAMRKEVGPRQSISLEKRESSRWVRWLDDNRVMFAGAERPVVIPRLHETILQQSAAELMYELSVRYPVLSGIKPAFGWDLPIVSTMDQLPWIGPHRNYPFHFFAMALGWNADGLAWFAARAAVRQVTGKPKKEDEAFGFLRAL